MASEPEQDNEQEARRLKAVAEKKYENSNLKSALKYAKRAHRLDPNLEGLSEMVTSFKILRVAATKSPGDATPDWYKVLQVEPFAHINTIKKQYKKLALVLHPDKNPYAGSEEAFKLVSEAFRFLSDRIRRKEYDMKLRIRIQEENVVGLAGQDTFWTACSTCRLLHKFERKYLGHNLVCPSCKKSFEAVEVEANDGDEAGKGEAEVRFRSERLRKKNAASMVRFGDLSPKPKVGSGEKLGTGSVKGKTGSGEKSKSINVKGKSRELEEEEEDGVDGDGIASGRRLRSWGLKRRMRTVGEVLESSTPKRAKAREETMTLAEMQLEAKRKVQQERMKMKLKEKEKDESEKKKKKDKDKVKEKEKEMEKEKEKEKEEKKRRERKKSRQELEIEKRGSLTKNGDLETERRRRKSIGLEVERKKGSRNGDLEIMSVEDSDFYDFDKDRVERSFKKGQVWAVYDDDDGMPRHYCLIDEVVSVNPFEVKMSWLDLQSSGDEGLICLEKTGFHISCGRFKVAWKTSINSVNIFSHVVDCERAAREVYRIYPKKGSVWALYNDAALDAEGNLSVKDKRCYDIVVFLTSLSETHGLSMAYLEKVDGFKTIFKRREIGSHAIRWLQKDDIRLFSHQIPARKLSGNEASEVLKDCWELDPASLPPDLLGIDWQR